MPDDRSELVRFVANAGVMRDGDPTLAADGLEPLLVGGVGLEVIAVPFDAHTRLAQNLGEPFAEVAVSEEDTAQAARSVPHGLFDLLFRQFVVSGEIGNRLASIDAIGDRDRGHPGPPYDWTSECHVRIDCNRARGIRRLRREEGIEPDWNLPFVPFHTLQVLVKDLPHRELAGRGQLDQLTVPVQEYLASIGAQVLAQQEALDAEFLLGVAQRLAQGLHGYPVIGAQGPQHMRLY